MSILEELYTGKIYPFEDIVSKDKNYCSVNKKIEELQEYFCEKLSIEDREKFEQWNNLIHESNYMDSYANFAYGFRLGSMLLIDVLAGFQPSEE